MNFTERAIAKLTLPAGRDEALYWDPDQPGFGVRLKGASRSYVVQYRIAGRQRRITLGPVARLTLADARREARKVLGAVHQGRDVQAERQAARTARADTFGALVPLYLARAERTQRPATQREARRYLITAFKPLHRLPLAELDRRTIARRLAELAERSGPIAANRARAHLSACLRWAVQSGMMEHNPVVDTPRQAERSRERVLTDDELAAVLRAAVAATGDYGRIVRLLILTGQRREEVAGLRWSELAGDLWILPATRTKNRRAHEVPLSRQAAAILAAMPVRAGRDLVFGQGEGGFSGWSQSKRRLDAAADVSDWTLHDLRRSMATKMANDLNINPHVIEAVLNHVSSHKAGVAGTYNRSAYTAQKRAALQAWADHLDRLLGREVASDNVVPLSATG